MSVKHLEENSLLFQYSIDGTTLAQHLQFQNELKFKKMLFICHNSGLELQSLDKTRMLFFNSSIDCKSVCAPRGPVHLKCDIWGNCPSVSFTLYLGMADDKSVEIYYDTTASGSKNKSILARGRIIKKPPSLEMPLDVDKPELNLVLLQKWIRKVKLWQRFEEIHLDAFQDGKKTLVSEDDLQHMLALCYNNDTATIGNVKIKSSFGRPLLQWILRWYFEPQELFSIDVPDSLSFKIHEVDGVIYVSLAGLIDTPNFLQ